MKQYSDFSKIIHKEGVIFVVAFVIATFFLYSMHIAAGLIGTVLTLCCAFFFRNPDRVVPLSDSLVISPADGIVEKITVTEPPSELNLEAGKMQRVSIFLSVFDVHVNRLPAAGKILKLRYNPGRFFNASLDKASEFNERQTVLMENKAGEKIVFVQIAGLIARRIICDLKENQEVKAGDRYGMIRFGSRVDLYLPTSLQLAVTEGHTCVGGETVIADFKNSKKTKLGFEQK